MLKMGDNQQKRGIIYVQMVSEEEECMWVLIIHVCE